MSALDALLLGDPWQISAAAYPEAGSAEEKLAFLLNYAVLAPSVLNTQPWKFVVRDGAVELHADRGRRLPIVDPDGRELLLSCGAALFNLCTAMRSFGHRADVRIRPNEKDADLLAVVTLEPAKTPSDLDRNLRDAIPKRRTVRRPFAERPLPEELLDELSEAAAREGADLSRAGDAHSKSQVAELVAEAERLHLADGAYRNELSAWIQQRIGEARGHDNEAAVRLGLGGSTPDPRATAEDLFVPLAASVARTFTSAEAAAAHQQARTAGAPAVVLLTAPQDSPRDWLAAGQALQRVLLTATRAGVSSSYLNPPVEIPSLRRRVAVAFGRHDVPQVLLRLGYGPDVPPASRRPVTEVVTFASS
ncbi:Acg family FMN-binding oxidoreductase [Microvirga massiliensis]|uniref:Acg family FMN-binding oxidoreductase n=1 Tax=Microvirga massiliensis TaxID=1033741 RepID=UPI00065FBB8E|nr:nitroreductase family protein [Microvirga massiliensis]